MTLKEALKLYEGQEGVKEIKTESQPSRRWV